MSTTMSEFIERTDGPFISGYTRELDKGINVDPKSCYLCDIWTEMALEDTTWFFLVYIYA